MTPDEANKTELLRGTGCDQCFHTGYMGRTGVFEVMTLDEDIRDAILKGKTAHRNRRDRPVEGDADARSLRQKESLGHVTTVEEIHRVLTAFSS